MVESNTEKIAHMLKVVSNELRVEKLHGCINTLKITIDEKNAFNIENHDCWDMRLAMLFKVLTKTMITPEDVESKHLVKLKHQE